MGTMKAGSIVLFIEACFFINLCTRLSNSFVIRTPVLRSYRTCLDSSQQSSSSSSSEGKKKQKRNTQKKRRFAQEVEPIVSFHPPAPTPQDVNYETRKSNQKPPPKRDSGGGSIRRDKRNNAMLQNGKSINELEGIMSKRWGTKLDKWTADFEQWEVVEEKDGGGASKHRSQSGEGRTSVKSGRKIRSKPVFNPWEQEEKQKFYDDLKLERKKKRENVPETTNASAFQSAKDRQNTVLDRVRKNQERLREQRGGAKSKEDTELEQSNKSASSSNEPDDLEFYDEDDEGYEPQPSLSFYDEDDEELEAEALDFYDNIISPNPVGGSGIAKAGIAQEKKNGASKGSGFFFNEAAASDHDEIQVEDAKQAPPEEKKKRKDEKKQIKRRPLLDEDGSKMLLTVDQAGKNLSAEMNASDGYSNVPESSWEDVGITHPQLLQNLESMSCNAPLSVQDKACPSIVSGNDVLVSTHTGSGKTLAFLTPLAQRLIFDAENSDGPGKTGVKVIIVAPGRELASQIVAVARDLFQGTGLSALLAIGGTPFSRNFEQIRKKKPDFLVGTPGRIAELVVGKPGDKSGKLKIALLQTIVLDECDALLEYKPHREPTAAIMEVLKRRHSDSLQSVLCSATAGDLLATSKLDGFLRKSYAHAQSDADDQSITSAGSGEVTRARVSRTAIHGVIHVQHQRLVLDTLRKILYTDPSPQQVLVFVDNARRVGIVVDKLAQMGIIAAPLHGGAGSEKGDRAEVNKALREGFVGLVVATEMAARGIDAPYLTHVINLDLPTDASHYAHRAGRCGRGGRPGVVINVAVGGKERGVPAKFAKALNIDMHEVEPQGGHLTILEPKKAANPDQV